MSENYPSRFADRIERIVVINDSTVARGGATTLAVLCAKLLRQRGLDVTYFAGDEGDVDGSLGAEGIDAIGLGNTTLLKSSTVGALSRGLYNICAYRALSDWIARNDTPRTVYHLHGWQQILSPAIFRALRAVSDRTLFHAHDYFLVCPNGGQMNYSTGTACSLRPMSWQCISTNCDKRNGAHKLWRVARHGIRNVIDDLKGVEVRIALIHRRMTEAFVHYGVLPSNLSEIANPSIPFSSNRVKAESNREFHFVGRLVAEKGINEFLTAARTAGVPVRVMGDGPLRQMLATAYPEFVFEGWCSRERLTEIVQTARMLVMPSLYPEPFGLVVPEAVSSGIPVLIAESALLAADVVRNRVGLTIDPGNGEQFAKSLNALALNNDLVGAMSKEGFENASGLATGPQQWISKIIENYCGLAGMIERPSA